MYAPDAGLGLRFLLCRPTTSIRRCSKPALLFEPLYMHHTPSGAHENPISRCTRTTRPRKIQFRTIGNAPPRCTEVLGGGSIGAQTIIPAVRLKPSTDGSARADGSCLDGENCCYHSCAHRTRHAQGGSRPQRNFLVDQKCRMIMVTGMD